MAYGDELNFSVVESFDNANKASGKLGGVAGVLAGVHNCNQTNEVINAMLYIFVYSLLFLGLNIHNPAYFQKGRQFTVFIYVFYLINNSYFPIFVQLF